MSLLVQTPSIADAAGLIETLRAEGYDVEQHHLSASIVTIHDLDRFTNRGSVERGVNITTDGRTRIVRNCYPHGADVGNHLTSRAQP